MKFKIGDAVTDLYCPDYGTGIVEIIEKDYYYISFENWYNREGHHPTIRGLVKRGFSQEHQLVLDELYHSPLCKALR